MGMFAQQLGAGAARGLQQGGDEESLKRQQANKLQTILGTVQDPKFAQGLGKIGINPRDVAGAQFGIGRAGGGSDPFSQIIAALLSQALQGKGTTTPSPTGVPTPSPTAPPDKGFGAVVGTFIDGAGRTFQKNAKGQVRDIETGETF